MVSASGEAKAFLEANRTELPSLFIVSQVELSPEPSPKAQAIALPSWGGATVQVEVRLASGKKSPRCWIYSEEVGAGAEVCAKCGDSLR